ncbi:choice-of-anchor G family protein [Arthrobacter sp. FX8]|uniref:choice-of-anchor G family protein n=1 Tax=Arthrobacter sp. FX8 TaxID=2997335 RepID=UPI00227C6773|nr:choice-of-anchor G family protein [Arthrobacter sp. FX8]WAJ33396.1 choice-of-anchor G family protein [Arthrobacter sp. FX8]
MTSPRRNLLHRAARNPRTSLAIAAAAAVCLAATTTVTTAAWVDNEWAAGSVGVGSPGDCATNTLFSGEASATQLTGSVLGTDLNSVAGVEGLTVTNVDGAVSPLPLTATPVTGVPDAFISKLPVTALGANPVTAGLGLGLPVGGLGTYTQWAQAQDSGQTRAAAGLVTDQSGAVDVGGTATGANTAPQAATISLGNVVPGSLAGVTLDVGAVASSASVQACDLINGWPTLAATPAVAREYGIASLNLRTSVPAIGALSRSGESQLDDVSNQLTALVAPGALTTAISSGLNSLLDPVLGLLDSSASTTATLSAPSLGAVRALMEETLVDNENTVAVDLAAGTVRIDIAALTDGTLGLNRQVANHTVLDSTVTGKATAKVTQLLNQWEIRVADALTAAIREATIESRSVVTVVGTLGVPVAEIVVATGPLKLNDFLAGTAPPPLVTSKLLGLGIGGTLLNIIHSTLTNGANGVIQDALRATIFTAGLVPQVGAGIDALVVDAGTVVGNLLSSISSLVSVHVNVQPDKPWAGVKPADVSAKAGEYKVSAVRIGVINDPEPLSLSLGTSSAGPVNYRPS